MSCRHVSTGGYRCSRPSLPAHRGYCRQHASLLHLPPPVPPPSQPSRRGSRGGGVGRPATSAAAAPHGASDTRRRSSSVGRTPTVEQLLGRIDRLRASSPSAESAWSEDSDHETPTLGSSRQYAGSGYAGDSSGAESGPEGGEPVDLLHNAGVYTAEEAALLARDKLVRQQALYIQQFSRLQHLLREGRRKYLHELKLERQAEADASKERQLAAEAAEDNSERASQSERGATADAGPGRSGGRGAPQRNRHDTEEKLRAVWRYHRHRGVCAVLRRKAWERRADTPAPPGPRCIHTEGGVRCTERCLPGSKYCLKHILNDPHQMLYVPCVGRRKLTLEQRDEEFSRNRRKNRRTSTAASRTSTANTSRQPAPTSSRTSARACARGMNPAVAAVLAARGRAIVSTRTPPPKSRSAAAARNREAVSGTTAPAPKNRTAVSGTTAPTGRKRAAVSGTTAPTGRKREVVSGTTAPTGRKREAMSRAVPAKAAAAPPPKAEAAPPSRDAAAGMVAGTAGRKQYSNSVTLAHLQRQLETQHAADVAAALKNRDAAALAAAFGIKKTPALEALVQRKRIPRMAAAMEKRDAAAFLVARKAHRPSGMSVASNRVGEDSAREVIDRSKKIAALSAVLQSEEATRLVSALKAEDAAAFFAALKSNDTGQLVAALRAKDADALAASLRPKDAGSGVPPTGVGRASDVPAVAATGTPPVRLPNVPADPAPATSGKPAKLPLSQQYKDSKVLFASLKPTDKAAVIAALKSKDVGALTTVLTSKSVAPVIRDLRAKGLILNSKAAKSRAVKSEVATPTTTEGVPAATTVVQPDPTGSVDVPDTDRPGDEAKSSSVALTEDTGLAVSIKSENRAALVAALKSGRAGALVAALRSRNAVALSAVLRARAMAVSPKSKAIAARNLALKGKVPAAVRAKSAAAKAAAAKLKAATTTLAAKKAKKRVRCQEPVLCVFEADMRCPWHAVYVPGDLPIGEGAKGGAVVPKEEIKTLKEEAAEDKDAICFGPVNKKMKMELDDLTPNIGGIVGDVEMKTEPNDEAADDMASVSGSGNQADQSTESTLSATSPRADDDDMMDDDCRDVDADLDAGVGEVMLQPPPGADDADLVAVAQGVAMVGAQEEVAVVQQDDDSLTNPPAAVDEVEVS